MRSCASPRPPTRASPAAGSIRSSSVRSGAIPAVPNAFSARTASTPSPRRGALVGERGVHEAVEQHEPPGLEQRAQPLLHELGARGGVDQRLRPAADRQRRVLDERAQALGELDASRLAQHDRVATRSASASPATSVLLPAPSIPSTVISTAGNLEDGGAQRFGICTPHSFPEHGADATSAIFALPLESRVTRKLVHAVLLP